MQGSCGGGRSLEFPEIEEWAKPSVQSIIPANKPTVSYMYPYISTINFQRRYKCAKQKTWRTTVAGLDRSPARSDVVKGAPLGRAGTTPFTICIVASPQISKIDAGKDSAPCTRVIWGEMGGRGNKIHVW